MKSDGSRNGIVCRFVPVRIFLVFEHVWLLQLVPNPAERDFDIFGNPTPRQSRPATAAARTVPSAAMPPPSPASGMGPTAGIPSTHNNARSPGARFSTARARAENENRRVLGHQVGLPVPGHTPPRVGRASEPQAIPSLASTSAAARPTAATIFRPCDMQIAPLSDAAAKHGPFKGRVVSGVHFRQAFVSSYAARPEVLDAVDPSLTRGRWPRRPSSARVGDYRTVLSPVSTAAPRAAPCNRVQASRHGVPSSPLRAAASPSPAVVAAGSRPSPRRSVRAMASPGGNSAMSSLMNWGH
jgi:hypothetical protein